MDGFERLKLMERDIKNPFLNQIVEFLLTREDLKDMYLKEEKTLNEMLEYIEYKALSICEKDKKKMPNGSGQYASVVLEDNQVYRWAALYFTFNNKYLGIDKMRKPPVVSIITQNKTKTKKLDVNDEDKKEIQEEQVKKEREQISLFE